MKLYSKNGEINVEGKMFLPTVMDCELELDEADIKKEFVHVNEPSWGKDGKFLKVTAPVLVTRYYPAE